MTKQTIIELIKWCKAGLEENIKTSSLKEFNEGGLAMCNYLLEEIKNMEEACDE